MKVINPYTRWNKIREFRDCKKIRDLKEQELEKFCNRRISEHRDWTEQEKVQYKKRMFGILRENNYNTRHLVTFYIRKFRNDTWMSDTWNSACHWISRVYLEYARKAYPEYYWYRIEGNAHSTVVGFKEKPKGIKRRAYFEYSVKVGKIIPDFCYDLLAYHFGVNPIIWMATGEMIEDLNLTNDEIRDLLSNS